MRAVVNATGTLLHTNLGRAPTEFAGARGYLSLESDLTDGRRGERGGAVRTALAKLCGADDALVVNNGAAALLLALTTVAAGRTVIVSRGELIEIGGSFRIPDIVEACGARIVEVGTTNRTSAADYRAAIDAECAAVLKVHTSNYRVVGFTKAAEVPELSGLGVPVVADIGSGLLDAQARWLPRPLPDWLREEPGARQTLAAGASLVVFSGDKLLGGPQAGIVVGDGDLVRRCARHPLARALRPGKLVLDTLMQTLDAYRDGDLRRIPLWRMALTDVDELARRAAVIAEGADVARVTAMDSVIGGGSVPGGTIPSVGLTLDDPRGERAAALRHRALPIVGRLAQGRLWLDLRTVDERDDREVRRALRELPAP
jgi:L-seryl-tRNA(Ser) seleniumtransferase